MPKILSDNGVEIYFEDYDILKNGDIFIHGVSKDPKVDTLPRTSAIIPMPKVVSPKIENTGPRYEPSKPVVRIARPPVKEVRLGIMCPHCYQSRTAFLPNDIVVVSKINNPASFIISQRIIWDDIITYNLREKNDLIKFLCESDEYIMSCLERTTIDLATLIQDYDNTTHAQCPLCNKSALLQNWITEYAHPSAEFFNICRVCGSEMSVANDPGNKKGKQIWKCDNKDCSYVKDT